MIDGYEAWHRHRGDVAAILDERFYPLAWVEARIADGSIAILHSENAIIGVERRVYPGGAVELHGMFAAGDKRAIRSLVIEACEAGRLAGCDIAAIESREGWGREFRDLGFRRERVRIVKDLDNGP
jgi:hypothetical protein